MEAAAIPGVAIPLLQDDCKDTGVDIEWVWEFIHLTSEDRTYRLDLDAVRAEVDQWFSEESLEELLGPADTHADRVARAWLAKAGKRWRPFLVGCVWKALQDDPNQPMPKAVRNLAVAVECFHKASLIHDDIEDGDELRYGEATVHAEQGLAVALNAGDLLLGEGYRMIAESGAPPQAIAKMLKIAADGHRTLCQGQGAELAWAKSPLPLSPGQVADIHRRKTAPAFEVALQLGATLAGADDDIHDILSQYSEALGIAYQIRDDLDDLSEAGDGNTDLVQGRPSFPMAVAFERAKGEDRELLEAVWRRDADADTQAARDIIFTLGAADRSRQMLDSYKEQAVRVLAEVQNASLKGLLRRVVTKIFSLEIKGWCSEFEARNASGSETRTEAVG